MVPSAAVKPPLLEDLIYTEAFETGFPVFESITRIVNDFCANSMDEVSTRLSSNSSFLI